MESKLYPSIVFTMTLDWASFLESQQAKPMVRSATPASFAMMMALVSIKAVPSKEEATKEGTITKAKPVAPSMMAVVVNSDFKFLKFLND
jgi:hypothetical protein